MDRALLKGPDLEQEVQADNDRWEITSYVRSTYSSDGAVLLDVEKGLCYSLNLVAARIWATIEASHCGIGIAGIADALETHFDVPRSELESDIAKYLTELERMGAVERKSKNLSSKKTAGRT